MTQNAIMNYLHQLEGQCSILRHLQIYSSLNLTSPISIGRRGEGEDQKRSRRRIVGLSQEASSWVTLQFKWNEFPNVMINGKERKGTFFSQSTMIHHIVSKNSLWYGELDFLPRWTWLYIRCVSRPGSEARWHFVLVFFFWRNLSFSWLTGEYHYPN